MSGFISACLHALSCRWWLYYLFHVSSYAIRVQVDFQSFDCIIFLSVMCQIIWNKEKWNQKKNTLLALSISVLSRSHIRTKWKSDHSESVLSLELPLHCWVFLCALHNSSRLHHLRCFPVKYFCRSFVCSSTGTTQWRPSAAVLVSYLLLRKPLLYFTCFCK